MADVAGVDGAIGAADAVPGISAAAPTGFLGGLRARIHRLRPQRLPLRRRIILTFALGSFALSAFLAAATYGFTKSTLLRQRDRTAIRSTYQNAQLLQNDLASDPGPSTIVTRLRAFGGQHAVVYTGGDWLVTDQNYDRSAVPDLLRNRVISDGLAARMITTVRGEPVIVTGVPLPESDSAYFEFSSLVETRDTLRSVARSLIAAAAVTTGLGVLLGALSARRAVRPLADAAQAAKAIAGGRLDTRLEPTDDPDLSMLSQSFNDMASALQSRVENDARFASDVSHELRSPLMTLAASAEVLQARRDELPEKAQAALDLLIADVARFQGLVEDLLEISRFDAGAIRLHTEELGLAEFVAQAVAVSSLPRTPVHVTDRGYNLIISGDKRRLARVIANLIDNARLHGGGDVTVEVSEAATDGEPIGHAWIAVSDHGAGVPAEERALVFDRFSRGGSAGRRSTSEGAGLGLALVDEHVRMHGGRAWVEDRLDGEPGARFVIELPAEEIGA
jgi:signal transduction histidine kinase